MPRGTRWAGPAGASGARPRPGQGGAGRGGPWGAGGERDGRKPPPPEPQRREPALRTIAMPADANANGDIFGGWVLAQMDLAGGSLAVRRARGRVATAAVTGVTFHPPRHIGAQASRHRTHTHIGPPSPTPP